MTFGTDCGFGQPHAPERFFQPADKRGNGYK
jgi:hypothetical protein